MQFPDYNSKINESTVPTTFNSNVESVKDCIALGIIYKTCDLCLEILLLHHRIENTSDSTQLALETPISQLFRNFYRASMTHCSTKITTKQLDIFKDLFMLTDQCYSPIMCAASSAVNIGNFLSKWQEETVTSEMKELLLALSKHQ